MICWVVVVHTSNGAGVVVAPSNYTIKRASVVAAPSDVINKDASVIVAPRYFNKTYFVTATRTQASNTGLL